MKPECAIYLTGEDLQIEDVINVAIKKYRVYLSKESEKKIKTYRAGLEAYIYNNPKTPVYGATRGCGDLKDAVLKRKYLQKYIDIWELYKNEPENKKRRACFKKYLAELNDYQIRYIKSHNCATGNPMSVRLVRAMMVIRLNSFAKGHSAVHPDLCECIIQMLNKDVTPVVLDEGSVGASGDLVPLAMIGAVILCLPEAEAYYCNQRMAAKEAFDKAGIDLNLRKLNFKEAMALTNGSTMIAAYMVFSYRDVKNLIINASISSSLSLEAIRGEPAAFHENIANARPHLGQQKISAQIRELINSSKRISCAAQSISFMNDVNTEEVVDSNNKYNFENIGRVQDRYSFRAIPQVHGAVYEALEKFGSVLQIEINSATDNPLFFHNSSGSFDVMGGANFHGQPLAVVIDYLKIALTGLALITDKRTFSLLDKNLSYGLPSDLAVDPEGGDTGLMIAQYADAARVAESRVLSTPASVTSVSTSANQEDFVSMGSIGVQHLTKVIYNTQLVISIELLCAFRGLQMTYYKLPLNLRRLGQGTSKVYNYLLKNAVLNNKPLSEDRYLRTDIEEVIRLISSNELVKITNIGNI